MANGASYRCSVRVAHVTRGVRHSLVIELWVAPANEFELDEPDPDSDAARQATVRRQMQRVARQASLDPEDGIEL